MVNITHVSVNILDGIGKIYEKHTAKGFSGCLYMWTSRIYDVHCGSNYLSIDSNSWQSLLLFLHESAALLIQKIEENIGNPLSSGQYKQ